MKNNKAPSYLRHNFFKINEVSRDNYMNIWKCIGFTLLLPIVLPYLIFQRYILKISMSELEKRQKEMYKI